MAQKTAFDKNQEVSQKAKTFLLMTKGHSFVDIIADPMSLCCDLKFYLMLGYDMGPLSP